MDFSALCVRIYGCLAAGNDGVMEVWIVKDSVALLTQTPETTADIAFDLGIEVRSGSILDVFLGMGMGWCLEATLLYVIITRCEDSLPIPGNLDYNCCVKLKHQPSACCSQTSADHSYKPCPLNSRSAAMSTSMAK